QQALGAELTERVSDGRARDPEPVHQLPLRGQRHTGRVESRADVGPQRLGDLRVQRHGADAVQLLRHDRPTGTHMWPTLHACYAPDRWAGPAGSTRTDTRCPSPAW